MNYIVITGITGAIGLAILRKCIEKKIHVLAFTRKEPGGIIVFRFLHM